MSLGGDTGAVDSSFDVDAAMATIEAGDEVAATPEKGAAAPAPTPQEIADLEFTWNGKAIKAPIKDPKTTQWLSQGYDYSQRMEAFKAQQTAFERQQKEFEPLKSRYSEIDEYAKANPQWLEQVNQSYLAAIGKADAQGQGEHPEIQRLKQELQDLKSFKEELTTERTQAKHKQEDQELDGQIQSIREKYKDLDWATANAEGKTLETQVIEFGIQSGIKSFEHAFKLFNHDSLITLHASKAKEEQVKAKQAQTKAGLLGSTPAPTKELSRPANIKSKSYNDITREVLEEMGITS